MRAAALALIGAAALASAGPARAQPAQPPPMAGIDVTERLGERVPLELVFEEASGRAVRLGDYFGGDQPVLLVLAYNRCAMLCSLVLRGVSAALAALDWRPGEQFRVVTVSIDPAETRHEAVRARQALLEQIGHPNEPERWPFLIGEEAAIRSLADSLGFRYQWDARTKQFAHPAVIFALTPDGTISRYLYGVTYAAGDLKIALLDASEGRTGTFIERVILSCFRFDPALRVYGGTIERFFKVGAVIIFGVVVAILLAMFRRERGRA